MSLFVFTKIFALEGPKLKFTFSFKEMTSSATSATIFNQSRHLEPSDVGIVSSVQEKS